MENRFMIGEYIQRCNPNGELLGEPFKATEIDFMFQDGRFVRAGNKTEELEKNNALLIEALKNISNGLAHAINATSTGTIRNLLTDVNIIALNAIK